MNFMSVRLKNTSIALLSFVLIAASSSTVFAQSSAAIAQSFKSDTSKGDIVAGALVSTQSNANTVELATTSTANQLVGVVDDNPLVTLSEDNQEVQVALSGTAGVLVTDMNGIIKSGDKITTSPIAGVGMKATSSSQVIGTAQNTFKTTSTQNITDRNGQRHAIHIGYVRAQISVTTYQASESDFLPPFIQNAANSIAGRSVSLVRVLGCIILLLLGFTTVIILVYTAVRSAMTSLGRNPLAAQTIRKGLYQVGAISLMVVGGTLVASYLILTV